MLLGQSYWAVTVRRPGAHAGGEPVGHTGHASPVRSVESIDGSMRAPEGRGPVHRTGAGRCGREDGPGSGVVACIDTPPAAAEVLLVLLIAPPSRRPAPAHRDCVSPARPMRWAALCSAAALVWLVALQPQGAVAARGGETHGGQRGGEDDFAVLAYLPEWRYEGANWDTICQHVSHLIVFSLEIAPSGAL